MNDLTKVSFLCRIRHSAASISLPALIIFLGVTGLLAIVISLRDFVQIWDGDQMLNCGIAAIKNESTPLKSTCAMHSRSGLYLAALAKIALLAPQIPGFIILFQFFLLSVSGFFFLKTLDLIQPAQHLRIDKALILLQYFFSPLILANLAYVSLDFPVLCLTAIFLYLILSKRYLLAAFTATTAYFCKATGFIFLQFTAACYIVILLVFRSFGREKFHRGYSLIFFFLPITLHLILSASTRIRPVIQKSITAKPSFCWSKAENIYQVLLNLDWDNKSVQNYLFNIFALNFNWIGSLIIIAFFLHLIIRIDSSNSIKKYLNFRCCFLFIALLGGAYIYTRCPHYNNPKYILTLTPLFLISYFMSLTGIFPKFHLIRRLIIIGFLTLQIISVFRTIDPISRLFYGTFDFGTHKLLHMTSRTGEYCGTGRDQTVYNLEYTKYRYLLDKIFNSIKPAREDMIVADYDALYNLVSIEFAKYTKSRNHLNNQPLAKFVTPEAALAEPIPGRLFLIDFPFLTNKRAFTSLSENFKILDRKTYELSGYALDVIQFSNQNQTDLGDQ